MVNNQIIIGVGDYGHSSDYIYKAQNPNSFMGKFLRFPLNGLPANLPEIIALGTRDPQDGLLFEDKVLSIEHGPSGGDEINLFSLNSLPNLGWPISSYGDAYGGGADLAELYKSHQDFGFLEPIFTFFDSVAPSSLSLLSFNDRRVFAVTTLGLDNSGQRRSVIFFDFDSHGKLTYRSSIKIGQRVRDSVVFGGSLLLATEGPDFPRIILLPQKLIYSP